MQAERPKIEIGYGFGKGEDAFILGAEVARQALAGIKEHPLSGVLVFASVRYDLVELLKGIYSLAGDVPMFGTTTAGEICDGVLHESVVIVALASPYLKVWISWGEGVSEDWQRAVTQAVSTPELRSFFSPRDSTIWPELTRQGKSAFALLFSPGDTRYNDSHSFEILEELKRLSGGRLPIFGGCSADDWHMEENYVFVGQRVYRDAVMVAVFETTLRFGIGLAHGLQPSSRRATVTRAHGHELLELDGKPAADAYAEMLGTTRVALEGWHLTLSTGQPAGILDPYGQYSINVASYFTPQGAVRFAQPVLEGTVLTIMEANQDSMITAGQEALRKATLRGQITQPVVALVCSCALRTQLLRERTQEELVGMKRIMPDIPLVGFYGFGEQGVADDGVNRHTDEAITVLVLGQELSFGAQLQQSEEKYRALIETTDTGYLIIDSEGRVLDANPEYVRLTGHAILQEILGRKVTEWTAEHDFARNASEIRECLSRGFVRNLEIDYINKHEQLTPIEINASVLRTADSLKIVALCRDITERKQNEQKIRRLNCILFTLNQVNQAVFHAQSREELFESVCRVVVKHGEIKFAWIGWHNPQTQAIEPVAYAGNGSDYLKLIAVYADERPEGLGPTGIAFREGKGVVCNDFAHDPRTKPWQEAAVRLGYRSSAVFPLRVDRIVRGTLNIYAAGLGFFQQPEVDLLDEVVANIALALDKFEAETQRRQSEEALRKSEARFRDLTESSADWIWEVNAQGQYTFASGRVKEILGYEPEELIGKTPFELMPEAEAIQVGEQFARLATAKEPIKDLENWILTKAGQLVCLLTNGVPMLDSKGHLLGYRGVDKDITERKRAEEALRESEERYRQLFELGSDALFLIENETGRILEVNAAAEELYGYCRKELLQIKNTDLSAEAAATRAATLEGQKRVPIRFHRKQDGSVFPVDIAARHFQWQKSGVHLAAIRDITERLRAQQEIEKQRSFLRTVIDAGPHFVYVKNRYGQIILVNQSLAASFGFTPKQLVGHEFSDFMVDSEFLRTLVDDDMAILTQVQDRIEREAQFVDQTGEARWFYTVKTPIKNEAGEVEQLIGVSIDITERKRMEAALFEAKERAQVTLHSIGDAVITTDAAGIVQYLNPVAEALTGWSVDEAQGRSLTEVFTIIDEDTRQPAPDPVARCLREGRITGLANHTCLLSRTEQEYAIQDSAAPIHSRDGEIFGVVVVFSDVTSSRRLAQVMSYQAAHDSLTGLINRQEFERRLQRVLETAQTEDSEHVLGYLDLDQFKVVNDTGGHVAGDELLRQLSELLRNHIRKRDTLARLGGDEFGLLMEHCPVQQARRVAETLRQAVENFRFFWEGKIFNVGVSIGLVSINQASENLAEVLSAADAACYMAKEQGRNRIHIYQIDDAELVQRHGEMQWAVRLPRALEEGRLRLWWQPIVPLSAHEQAGVHYELLLRLEDETGRLVLPGTFLPAAERYYLTTRLDRWVFSTALQWLARHPDQLQHLSLCTINLSGHSLGEKAFLEFVLEQLEATGIPAEKICFEITETAAIANLVNATHFINALKAQGCRFALDDFGSGLSSFAYLKTLPVDYVKIDGAFVKDIATEPTSFAIVKAMHEIAQVMGKQTIAEFVESAFILEKLHEIGVDYAQGYFIGRPQPLQRW